MLKLLVSRSPTDEVEVPTPSPKDAALSELREYLAALVPDALRRDGARLAELRDELAGRNEVVAKLAEAHRNGSSNTRAIADAQGAVSEVEGRMRPVRARLRSSREAFAADLVVAVRRRALGDAVAKCASQLDAVRAELWEIERFAQNQGCSEFVPHWLAELPHPDILFAVARRLGASEGAQS